MKKLLSTIFLFSLVLGTTFAAPKNTPAPQLEPIEFDPVIQIAENGTKFVVDPRIEIIGIICRLAEYQDFTNYYIGESTYTTQIDNLFGKKKDHPAVKQAVMLKNKGVTPDAMVSLAYYINPDFSGVINDFDPRPQDFDQSWEKIKTKDIYKFIQLAHDFAVETNYTRIFILNRPTLLAETGYIKTWFEKYKFSQIVDNYYPSDPNTTNVISINMISPGYYYATTTTDREGNKTTYTTAFAGCNYFDLLLTYFQAITVDTSRNIFEQTKDAYSAYITNFQKKSLSEEDFKKWEKDFKINPNYISSAISAFMIFPALSDPLYIEACQKDDYPVTYEGVYSSFEKFYDGEYFARGVKLVEDYINNREQYPTIDSYKKQIAEYINSLPSE